MIRARKPARAAFVSWLIIFLAPGIGAAQDALARAKDLYTSAAYDEALAALTDYQPPPDRVIEADEYRAFCLLALGKRADAGTIIERIVTADPSFLPGDNQVSPRVQDAFREVRRRVLPSIVRGTYADGKRAFDRKEFDTAAKKFDRVLALLNDPAAAGATDLTDLRLLSNGFLDLIKTATAAPPPPPAAATAPAPAPAARVYSVADEDVVPPTVISQALPPWRPSRQDTQTYEVALIVVIDEMGSVASFRLEGKLHPPYDEQVREAVRRWKYRPAMKGSTPVKYQKVVAIRLSPADASPRTTTRR